MPLTTFLAATILLAAKPAVPQRPDPLAPARAGQLACHSPKPAQRTCRALTRIVRHRTPEGTRATCAVGLDREPVTSRGTLEPEGSTDDAAERTEAGRTVRKRTESTGQQRSLPVHRTLEKRL